MSTNFNQTSDLMLLELINTDNAQYMTVPLSFSVVQFAAPVEAINGQRNTTVLVSALPQTNVTGSRTVAFARLDFDIFFNSEINIEIPVGDAMPETTSDLLGYINTAFGLQLTNADIIVEAINGSTEFLLRANPNSFVWIGEVNIVLDVEPTDLADIIVITELSGFEYPTP